jgi:hypothetical protein
MAAVTAQLANRITAHYQWPYPFDLEYAAEEFSEKAVAVLPALPERVDCHQGSFHRAVEAR